MSDHKTYRGVVRFKDGLLQEVEVEAADNRTAWQMLEFRYGQGNVQGVNEVSQPASSTLAANGPADKQAAPGQNIALIVGGVVFVGLYKFGLDWRWALGVGVVVWFSLAFWAMRPR